MLTLTLNDISAIISGELLIPDNEQHAAVSGETTVGGAVDTDSRLIGAGDIFVAKPGEFSDGHLFIDAAIANGAALVIGERELTPSVPYIRVANVIDALAALATEVVARVRAGGDLFIVGITGSNGKTTTKNLVRAILEHRGPTIAPRDSFNNEVGAPLTMLKLTPESKYLVAEMGASGRGEITKLIRMAKPDVGVVLTVGLAHAGEFGGIETTLATKTEMVTDLNPDDVAVLNADDVRVVSMAAHTKANVLWFGTSAQAAVRAESIDSDVEGTRFDLVLPDGFRARVTFRVLGEHHVMNALAAAAVCFALGVPGTDIVVGLESVTRAEKWRMELHRRADGVTVINDAYNASPDSMAAALRTLAQISTPENRTFAILGEMSELGEFSRDEHDRIGRLVVRLGVHQLIVVGEPARALHLAAAHEGSWDGEALFVDTADEALELIAPLLRDGDIVLVKSSNSAGLRFLGDRLVALAS